MLKVAICAIVKDELPYILEWIAFHRMMGVSHFRVYDNESNDGTYQLLQALAGHPENFLECISHPSIDGVSPQLAAYNDSLPSIRKRADFVAFIDADEFIYPTSDSSLPNALEHFPSTVGAIAINQRVFGASGNDYYKPDLVISRFIHRAPDHFSEGRFFKTIGRPEFIYSVPSCHQSKIVNSEYVYSDGRPLILDSVQDHGYSREFIDGKIGLHHYILKSRQEFEAKRLRGGGMQPTQEARKKRYAGIVFDDRDSVMTEVDHALADKSHEVLSVMSSLYSDIATELPSKVRHVYEAVFAAGAKV